MEIVYEFEPPIGIPPHGTAEVNGELQFCTVVVKDKTGARVAFGRYQRMETNSGKFRLISGTAFPLPKESVAMDKLQIAKVCHEANRAYCASIGDYSQPSWGDAPEWQKASAINGVNFHLTSIANGVKPSPSASHDSWLEEKRNAGWKYGPVKNPETKEHPCFVPYAQLSLEQKLKDYIFVGIVQAFFEANHQQNGVSR